MSEAVPPGIPPKLNSDFLEEYSSEKSVRRYTKETAGNGISYLLNHDYGDIYLSVLENYIPKSRIQKGIRVWEFGCGGAMNLLHFVSLIQSRGIGLDCAYGTDFSGVLIEAARHEAKNELTPDQSARVRFCVARNDSLIEDATTALGIGPEALLGSFDVMVGVNTIRYCHRFSNQNACASEIFNLLADGGVCIIIDMNNKFPAFRSRFRDCLTKDRQATFLPSLDEYARPFSSAGFEILRKENFCWVPHSAGPKLTTVMRAMTPILNGLARSHAMRSLVIARKPEGHHQ